MPAPVTDALIAGVHVQHSGGSIECAQEEGIENPTQYWHLMESWSA
ncbi:hypothetical protein [Alloscardovia sp. HMSC034E08]|nr:hypothetical protein [Alloscardovia sp. HMSC034E08]